MGLQIDGESSGYPRTMTGDKRGSACVSYQESPLVEAGWRNLLLRLTQA
jgi:hypothetical protein